MRAIHLIKKSVYMVTALIFYEINIEVSHKYTRLIFFINLAKDCFQVCFKFIKIAVRRSINCSYDDFSFFFRLVSTKILSKTPSLCKFKSFLT